MWYRKILAYREIIDPRGEKSIHKHKIEGGYHSPMFVMKPGDTDISEMLGTGSKVFGPGHYTSQNKVVAYGYNYPFTREEKFPMGTRILDYDKIDNVHGKKIVDALNQKYNKDIVIDFPIDMQTLGFKLGLELNEIYPILVELGYDAIEYNPGRNFTLDSVVEGLKGDPNFIDPRRRKVKDKSSLPPVVKPKSFNRRIKKLKQQFNNKNVLVINANILTNPRLFQKERFRPETLTEEEKETLEKGKYASTLDVTLKVIEYLKKTDPDWQKKLRSFSCEAILNLLVAGVIDSSFPFETIYKNALNGQKALNFLSKGVDPSLVIAYTRDITFDNYEDIKYFLEQKGKEYLVPKLESIISYRDPDTIVKFLQSNIVDKSTLKSKFLDEISYQNPEKISISDLEKLISAGFTADDFSYVPLQFLPEDTQRLLNIGFDKKYLLNDFAARNVDFSKTGFTVEDIIENFDLTTQALFRLMVNLSSKNIDVKPLWKHVKGIFSSQLGHLSYDDRQKYVLEIIEALKNTDVSLKEIIDFTLKPNERAVFVEINFSDSDELKKPENAEISNNIKRYNSVQWYLEKLQEYTGDNTLVCQRCGYIFINSYCPKCGKMANNVFLQMPAWMILDAFSGIARIYQKSPESIDLLSGLIYQYDGLLGNDIRYEMRNSADPSEFVNDNLSKFLNKPIYLEMFSSLRTLKEKIDKNAIAPNSTTNVNDETISQPDSNED